MSGGGFPQRLIDRCADRLGTMEKETKRTGEGRGGAALDGKESGPVRYMGERNGTGEGNPTRNGKMGTRCDEEEGGRGNPTPTPGCFHAREDLDPHSIPCRANISNERREFEFVRVDGTMEVGKADDPITNPFRSIRKGTSMEMKPASIETKTQSHRKQSICRCTCEVSVPRHVSWMPTNVHHGQWRTTWCATYPKRIRCETNARKVPTEKRRMTFGTMDRRRADAAAVTSLTLNVGETSVSFPLACEDARTFQGMLQELLQVFKEKEAKGQRKKLDAMDYQCSWTTDGGNDGHFQVYCNPNAYASAYHAKALITVQSNSVQVMTEGKLSAIKSDLDSFVDGCS